MRIHLSPTEQAELTAMVAHGINRELRAITGENAEALQWNDLHGSIKDQYRIAARAILNDPQASVETMSRKAIGTEYAELPPEVQAEFRLLRAAAIALRDALKG